MNLGSGMNSWGLGDISPEDMIAIHHQMRQAKLRKSTVTAGYGGAAGAGGTGAGYIPQSLENTLAVASFKREDCIFWNMVSKSNVFSTVNEYGRIDSHGQFELDPFFAEGGLPSGATTVLTRAYSKITYIGAQGAVSFPMLRSRVIGGAANAEAQEVLEKTLHLLGRVESMCYFSDSRVNPYAFDGLRSIIEQGAPNNIVDMRGQMLTGRKMRSDMSDHRDLYAMPNVVLMSNGLKADLGNLNDASIRRAQAGNQAVSGKLGMRALGIAADHGDVDFKSTVFLQPGGAPNTAAIQPGTASAPTAPTIASATLGTNSAGRWEDDYLGTYYWKVVAVGPNGISAPTKSGSVAVTATGKRVVITITDNAVSNSDVWYYRLYRSKINEDVAANYKYVGQYAKAAFGVDTVLYDYNLDIPGTTWAFSIQMTPDVIEVIRLLDFMKQDLAIVDTTKRFALIMFAALRSRTPTKMWAWKNIGRLPE